MTEKGGGHWLQTIYYPFYYFANYAKGIVLNVSSTGPVYDCKEFNNVPYVDSIVAIMPRPHKGLWITCPKWFSSIIYIAMGWTCLPVFTQLWTDLPHAAFGWLLAGGIIYTIGGCNLCSETSGI